MREIKKSEIWVIILAFILTLSVMMGCYQDGYNNGKTKAEIITKYVESANEERELELISLGIFETSAYDACYDCCGKLPINPNYGKTATGTRATAKRTIAVDPNVIPYGAEVVIDGQTYIAEDTGGAIKGNKIDIYFNTHTEALQYGRRKVEVFVLR